MCRLLGINRCSYYSYQWRKKHKPEDPEYNEILGWAKKISESSQHTYGRRRMRKALNALGYPVGLKKTKRVGWCGLIWGPEKYHRRCMI
jgi:hypothetical protein